MEFFQKEVVSTSKDDEKLKMETIPESQKETSTNDDGEINGTQEPCKETTGAIETQKVRRQWCMEHFSIFFNKLISWWQNRFGTLKPEYLAATE